MALDFEALKSKLVKTESGGGGDRTFWRPQSGRNEIRILPSKARDNDFYAEAGTRWNVGPNKKKVFVPVDINAECPIKEFANKLKDSGDPEDEKLAKKMRYSTRYFFNVIDTSLSEDDEKYGKVQIYEAPVTVFKQVLALLVDPDYGNLLDENNGHNLTIEKTGKELTTEYAVRPRKDGSPIIAKDWEDNLANLQRLVEPKSYNDRLAILKGEEPSRQGNSEPSNSNSVTQDVTERVNAQAQQAPPQEESNPWANTETVSADPAPQPEPEKAAPASSSDPNDAVRDEIAALLSKRK